MIPDYCGNDVAALLEGARRNGCSWGAVASLPVPYLVDQETRFIYVDGRLPLQDYFTAVTAGMSELVCGTEADPSVVVPIFRGPGASAQTRRLG